jgi:hypothetical protein
LFIELFPKLLLVLLGELNLRFQLRNDQLFLR